VRPAVKGSLITVAAFLGLAGVLYVVAFLSLIVKGF
jgi:hypothetical protein